MSFTFLVFSKQNTNLKSSEYIKTVYIQFTLFSSAEVIICMYILYTYKKFISLFELGVIES